MAEAKDFSNVITARLLPGWQLADGTQMAGLSLQLEPGWKTYWRTPGDSGIPPQFDWTGSRNVLDVDVLFPRPRVFHEDGGRTIGYKGTVILPLQITPDQIGDDIHLAAQIELGICREVCLPHRVSVDLDLTHVSQQPDAKIAASLASIPFDGEDLGLPAVSCTVTPGEYGLRLTSRIKVTGQPTDAVIESSDPNIWISEPQTSYENGYLIATSELMHMSADSFALDRSSLIYTLFGPDQSYEMHGCS